MSVGIDHLETQLARAIGLTPELGCRGGEVARSKSPREPTAVGLDTPRV